MWDNVTMQNFVVPVINIQIGLGNNFLFRLLDFIDSDVEKLSIGEEVGRNKLVTVNQVIKKKAARPPNIGCQ